MDQAADAEMRPPTPRPPAFETAPVWMFLTIVGVFVLLAVLTVAVICRRRRAPRLRLGDSPTCQLEVPADMGMDPFVVELVGVLRLMLAVHPPTSGAAYAAAMMSLAEIDTQFRTRLHRPPDTADAKLTLRRELVLDDLVVRSSLILKSRFSTSLDAGESRGGYQ